MTSGQSGTDEAKALLFDLFIMMVMSSLIAIGASTIWSCLHSIAATWERVDGPTSIAHFVMIVSLSMIVVTFCAGLVVVSATALIEQLGQTGRRLGRGLVGRARCARAERAE